MNLYPFIINDTEYAWRFNEAEDETEVYKVIYFTNGQKGYELVTTGERAHEMIERARRQRE